MSVFRYFRKRFSPEREPRYSRSTADHRPRTQHAGKGQAVAKPRKQEQIEPTPAPPETVAPKKLDSAFGPVSLAWVQFCARNYFFAHSVLVKIASPQAAQLSLFFGKSVSVVSPRGTFLRTRHWLIERVKNPAASGTELVLNYRLWN